jgi:hypothetical protein
VAQLVEALRYKPVGRGFGSRWDHRVFPLTYSFRLHYGPKVDSASDRNQYRGYLLEGKGGRCVGLITLPLSCAGCQKFWQRQPPGCQDGVIGIATPGFEPWWGAIFSGPAPTDLKAHQASCTIRTVSPSRR